MTTILHKAVESEKAFIGSLLRLVNEDKYDEAHEAASSIEVDDFSDASYKAIFGAFRKLLDRGEPFDHRLLVAECNGGIENVAYLLLEAGESVATSAHINGHAGVIRKAAEQRRAVCVVQDSLNELGRNGDATATIDRLRNKLGSIITVKGKAEPIVFDGYKPFPIATLPAVVGDYVEAAATAIGCDPSFIALPLLGCLARAVGNKRVIRLKRSWCEPAVIWAAIIGKSGTHKTPALSAATTFPSRKQSESITAYQESLVQFEQDKALYDRDYAAWKRAKTTDPPPWLPEVPTCERYITTDCTIEALALLLHNQYDGILVSRDELSGWLGGIAEYKGGQGSDLGHWLAMWSAAPLTVDRKTGATKMIHVPRAAVSIVGGIQPGVLRRAIGHEHMQDGLCARLLLAMPDPKPVRWTDATIDQPTEAAMSEVFEKLIGMGAGADDDGQAEPFAMPLTAAAKELWVDYYNRHRAESVGLDDDLCAAWSKLEAYAARFALIFQCCSWAAGAGAELEVDEVSIGAGISLADWFGGEARRVYGLFSETNENRERRELIDLITRRRGHITARELTNSGRRYRGAGEAEAALDGLARAELGRWRVIPTSGRPRREFHLSTVATEAEVSKTAEIDAFASASSVDSAEALADFKAEQAGLSGGDDIPF